MNEANPEPVIELLNEGIDLYQHFVREQRTRIEHHLKGNLEMIETHLQTERELLRYLRGWRDRLKTSMGGTSFSQLISGLDSQTRSSIQFRQTRLKQLVIELKSVNQRDCSYLNTSLCFTQGLLQSVFQETPNYNVTGHLQTAFPTRESGGMTL